MKHSIEQYLKALTNASRYRFEYQFEIDPSDAVVLNSIARQVNRGIALTDRQYQLVKTKLASYKSQFEKNGLNNFDEAMNTLDQPIRLIDRSQTVSIENNEIVIKFPFNKKIIAQLDKLIVKYRHFHKHERNSNIHRFKMYEPLIYEVVELFRNKKFEIEPRLIELSDEIQEIMQQESSFVPYVCYTQGVMNLSDKARDSISQDLGEFNDHTMIKYWDRSIRYGYRKTARVFRNSSALAEHLANRQQIKEYINPDAYTLTDISCAIEQLDRFPLLVTLDRGKELADFSAVFSAFDFVDPQHQVLLNRIEDRNSVNYPINTLIKEKNLNNWLDESIKIVYIFKSSLPKLLVKNNWKPIAHLSLSSERGHTTVEQYVEEHCDLMVYHDSLRSHWSSGFERQLIQWV